MIGQLKCDSCGKSIESINDGLVEWLKELTSKKIFGMRIVHSVDECQHDRDTADPRSIALQLSNFSGKNEGLMRLLSKVNECKDIESAVEVGEVIKRLYIPNYEIARFYFDEAKRANWFESNDYIEYDIKTINDIMNHIDEDGNLSSD